MKHITKILEGLYSCVMVGGAVVSANYHGEAEWFTKGYLHDITLPFGMYFFNKLIEAPLSNSKLANASFFFLSCSAVEIAQGVGLYRGTFDPKDFLAYAAGAGLAVAVDKISFKKKTLDNTLEESI